jgi:hypothetical protein
MDIAFRALDRYFTISLPSPPKTPRSRLSIRTDVRAETLTVLPII